jgi:hypothetical protein
MAGPLLEARAPHLFISIFDLPSSIFSQLVALSSLLRADMPFLLISIAIPFSKLRSASNTSCREGRRIDREAAREAASDRAITSQQWVNAHPCREPIRRPFT